MKRRALIIYCDNTESGELRGPVGDYNNFYDFLTSHAGGDWYSEEIESLRNPTSGQVNLKVDYFLGDADYSFIIFSGHGFINTDKGMQQYVELSDGTISIRDLRTAAPRQTLIIDACRGYYSPARALIKGIQEQYRSFTGDATSTRRIFENAVLGAEMGWTVLFAANENQTALDTDEGGAYLLSLLSVAELWAMNDKRSSVLTLRDAHDAARDYVLRNFNTTQQPTTNQEKRLFHFPFSVKYGQLQNGGWF